MRNMVLSSLLLVACSKNADAPPPSAASEAPASVAPSAQPSQPAVDPSAHLPPGHPAVGGDKAAAGGHPPATTSTPPTGPASAGGLTWDAPAPLVRRSPKSSMRIAEYGLEDTPEAELTVFYFGSDQGGTVDANMQRWIGQFKQPDGSEAKAKRSEKKVKNIEVALVETQGVYSGGMAMPGAPTPAAVPDAMLLGAIAKGPEGAVFFKFVGPRASVEKARPAFDGLVKSIKPAQ